MLAAASTAFAGPRSHDGGFFLRLSAGAGAASSEISDGTDKLEISGTGGDVNLAVGAVVTPNLALHGTLFGWSISNPDLTFNEFTVPASGDATVAGMGVGLTYYLMPANLYFSTSLGTGKLEFEPTSGVRGETDSGLMFDLTLGKEWWVGDNWGLGVAGGLLYHSFSDPDVNENWTGTSFMLRFTATRN